METKKEVLPVEEESELPFSLSKPSVPLFFYWAEKGEHEKIAKLDLELSKAFISTIKSDGFSTPLHVACTSVSSNFETIKILLELGSDPMAVDDKKNTPLHYAAKLSRKNVLEILIKEYKVNVNAWNQYKETPFHFWLSSESIPYDDCFYIFDMFVAAGANANLLTQTYGNSLNNLGSKLISSVSFNDKLTKVEKFNKESIKTAVELLPKLLALKPDVNAIGSVNTEGSNDYRFGSVYRKDSTTLGSIVKFAAIVNSIMKSTLRKVDQKPVQYAFRHLMKFAKILLDQEDTEFEIQLDDESRETILSTIIRNELALLIQHPKIQKSLNKSWGPKVQYRGSGIFTSYPWVDANQDELLSWLELFQRNIATRRLKFWINALGYFTWVILLSIVFLQYNQSYTSSSFYFTDTIRSVVSQDISNTDDLYGWMTTTLPTVIFPNPQQEFSRYDRILHGRVRQLRVSNSSCEIPVNYRNLTEGCFSSYSEDSQDKSPFTPTVYANTTTNDTQLLRYLNAWTFTEPTKGNFPSYIGYQYPSNGGFVYEINMNDSVATIQDFNRFQNDDWIDDSSAAVIVEFYAFNGNLNRFITVRCVFELANNGRIVSAYSLDTFQLSPYALSSDKRLAVIEVIVLLFFIGLVIEELVQLARERLGYFTDKWNWWDCFIYAWFLVVIGMRIAIYAQLAGITFDQTVNQFDDFDSVVYIDKRQRDVIFVWGGLMKYFRILYDCGILIRIMTRQVRNVINFLFVYLVFLIGFASAFNLLIGNEIRGFRSWGISLITTFKVLAGDVDWDSIQETNRWLALALMVTHSVIAIILLLNLLIAMLNQSYSDVIVEATVEHMCERANIILSYGATMDKNTKKIADVMSRQKRTLREYDEPKEEEKKEEEKKEEEKKDEGIGALTGSDQKEIELKVVEDKEQEEEKKDKYDRVVNKKDGEELAEYEFVYKEAPKPGLLPTIKPKVYCSPLSVGKPEDFLSFEKQDLQTTNKPFSYFAVDLGETVRIRPTHFRSILGAKDDDRLAPNNFMIQGSNLPRCLKDEDLNAPSWDNIALVTSYYYEDYHDNVTDLPKIEKFYRFFRLIQIGYNTQFRTREKKPDDPEKGYIFAIKGFDLYGIYRKNVSAAEANNEIAEEKKEDAKLKAEIEKADKEKKEELEKQSELENDTLAIVKKLREEQAQTASVIASLTKTVQVLQERLLLVDGKVPEVSDFDFVFDD